jgi:hypothetical protein
VYNGVACFGEDLSNEHRLRQLELKWLIKKNREYNKQSEVLQSFFTKLAEHKNSNNKLKTESQKLTLESWETGLEKFKKMRAKYLIY